jgi:phosphate uptake regulator
VNSSERAGEVRRIQVTGRGSYIVSLPKRWVKERNLDRGEQIVFSTEDDGTLHIMPRTMLKKTKLVERTILVPEDMSPESLARRVISFYLVGFTFIRLKATKARFEPAQLDYIKEFVRKKLVGSEIVTESPNEIALQVLISYPELSVENALRRMFIICVSMLKDAVAALVENNPILADEVLKMDDEVDRFGFYIVRQLKMASQDRSIVAQIGLGSGRDLLGYRLVTKSIERAADHAAMIAQNVRTIKQTITPRLKEKINRMSEFVTRVCEDSMTALYKRDYGIAERILGNMSKTEALEKEVIVEISKQRIDSTQMSALRLIVESLRRVGEYGSDVAEAVLNLTAAELQESSNATKSVK